MDRSYLLTRMQASLAMARRATDPIVKLIHFELAGRYSVAASGQDTTSPRADRG